MHGHDSQLQVLSSLLASPGPRAILLRGPDKVGKFSAALEAARSLSSEEDLHICEDGVDGAREGVAFCRDEPISSPRRIVLIRDVDRLSDAAQDAWLKSSEEPHSRLAIIAVSADPGGMHPALLSRFRDVVSFSSLSPQDILSYAESTGTVDDFALGWCDGSPGLYNLISSTPGAKELLASLESLASGSPFFDVPLPDLLSECSKPDPRSVVIQICRKFSRLHPDKIGRASLAFAADISRISSANAEIHFQRRMVSSSRV